MTKHWPTEDTKWRDADWQIDPSLYASPIWPVQDEIHAAGCRTASRPRHRTGWPPNSWPDPACWRSEEHQSGLPSLMRTTYADLCLKQKRNSSRITTTTNQTTHKE